MALSKANSKLPGVWGAISKDKGLIAQFCFSTASQTLLWFLANSIFCLSAVGKKSKGFRVQS